MASSATGTGEPCVNMEQFEAMKARFRNVGDCLTDAQLLELADCYHEILRWRREVRLRHASPPTSAEARTFAAIDRDAVEAAASGLAPFPPPASAR